MGNGGVGGGEVGGGGVGGWGVGDEGMEQPSPWLSYACSKE